MAFFGLVAAVLLILGIGFFIPVFVTFLETGRVGKNSYSDRMWFCCFGSNSVIVFRTGPADNGSENRQDFEMELQRIQEQYNKLL